jgi:hypothetical protein
MVRVERVKEFCNSAGQDYKQTLCYASVRWLSLLPALEKNTKNLLFIGLFFYIRYT